MDEGETAASPPDPTHTNKMRVFDDFQRTDSSRSQNSESMSAFLNRAHTPYFEAVRQLVEDWFTRLCPSAQADVRGRLRDDDNLQFRSAFWELYLHETLVKSGYTVECHPEIAGTTRRPDFLATSAGQSFYLEAICMARPDEKQASERDKNRIYDAIQGINSPTFYVSVHVESVDKFSPPTGPLRRELEAWLAGLNPDVIGRQIEADHSFDDIETYEWRNRGWHISFQPIPKSPENRGKEGIRPIGMYDYGASFADDRTPFRAAVATKGKAYGTTMDLPFIVAVGTSFLGPDGIDVSDALDDIHVGYFRNKSGWHHPNVSGVLVAQDILPTSVTKQIPTFWGHPAASHPVDCLPAWGENAFRDNRRQFTPPRRPIHELLGLPEQWPPGKPFDQQSSD